MTPIRLIQVGMGGWGQDWQRNIVARSDDVACVAYVDLAPALLEQVQKLFGVESDRCFMSLDAALAAVDADAVLITASLAGHVPAALTALRAGKHVLLEKPFAPSLAEALDVVAAAERADRVLMISQNYRYYPAVRAVADLIRRQELGPVSAVDVQFRKYANVAPRGTHRHYEITQPLLLDMAIHHFDLLRYVLNQEPTAVACHAWNPPWSNFREPAAAAATITFDGGAVVQYSGNWVSTAPQTHWAGSWQIECEQGVITWTSRDNFSLAGDMVKVKRPRKRVYRPRVDYYMKPFDRGGTLAAFVDAIRTGTQPPTSGRDNLMTLALTHAAIRAATDQAIQTIPRDFQSSTASLI